MSPEQSGLVKALLFVAQDLDNRAYPYSGTLRRAAQIIASLEARAPEACPQCGETVEQPGRGRPRVYCSRKCRNRARYQSEIVESSP